MSRRPLRGRHSPHMVISLRHAGWGRRTHRNGTRPAHDLQEMGRQACWRSDIAYLARWRRASTRRGRGDGGMHLGPRRSARQTPSRFVPNHAYIAPAGKISPAATKLRPVFQIPWSGRPPPRAGRTAARFGSPLTARTARHPVCGEPFLPPNFRRRVAGVPPVRREALRVGCGFSFSRADVKTPEFRGSFSLKLLEHCQICASRRIKGGKLKAILKYISQNFSELFPNGTGRGVKSPVEMSR